jgi:ribonuclease III
MTGSASGGPYDRLETRLGHTFTTPAWLLQALTHASATEKRVESNERLEFLGDRVLGLVIAEMLLEKFTDEQEGDLGYRFTALARREALARVALDIELGAFINLSDGERDTGGAEKAGVLANTCEAVIAALYLDGGLEVAARFIKRYWEPLLEEDLNPRKDPKTVLQEWAQAAGKVLPKYKIIQRVGPDHAPSFTVEVTVQDEPSVQGQGAAKRAAEQAAAEKMLLKLGVVK